MTDKPKLRFIIWQSDNDKQYYWRCRETGNNEIIAHGEGYVSAADAKHAVYLLQMNAYGAEIDDRT